MTLLYALHDVWHAWISTTEIAVTIVICMYIHILSYECTYVHTHIVIRMYIHITSPEYILTAISVVEIHAWHTSWEYSEYYHMNLHNT